MNDIKSKLKILANKQEIHDLSSRIIDNVDTSRVIIAPERKRRIFGLYTTLVSAITACTILLIQIMSLMKWIQITTLLQRQYKKYIIRNFITLSMLLIHLRIFHMILLSLILKARE